MQMADATDLSSYLDFILETLAIRREVMVSAAKSDLQKLSETQAHFHARLNVRRKPVRTPTPAAFSVDRDVEATVHVPAAFFVAEHHHDRYGRVHVAVFGPAAGNELARLAYHELWVSFPNEGPEIVAAYLACHECNTLELGTASSCSVCKGHGWTRRFGKPVAPFGTPDVVLPVQPPHSPEHRAHYDALINGEQRERT